MKPIVRTQSWLPEVFNDMFDNNWLVNTHITAPAVNVIENENEYLIEVAAPGMQKSDFHISTQDDQLVISLEKKEDDQKKVSHYLRREFNYSSYKQAFVLPDDVKIEQIGAKMEHGVLTITLPKKEEVVERQKNRDIEIA